MERSETGRKKVSGRETGGGCLLRGKRSAAAKEKLLREIGLSRKKRGERDMANS